jgi:hypothetical protein
MGRRQQIYVGTTISLDDHARLVRIAETTEATLADVLRELIGIAVKSPSKSSRIRDRISFDNDDDNT